MLKVNDRKGMSDDMSKRIRGKNIRIEFWTDEQELRQIQKRMSICGIKNLSAYLRQMALKGYILQINIPELRELISLLRIDSNNLNQIARRVNETNRFYASDLEEMKQKQEEIWNRVNIVLKRFTDLD